MLSSEAGAVSPPNVIIGSSNVVIVLFTVVVLPSTVKLPPIVTFPEVVSPVNVGESDVPNPMPSSKAANDAYEPPVPPSSKPIKSAD